jgi:hypothetical protein
MLERSGQPTGRRKTWRRCPTRRQSRRQSSSATLAAPSAPTAQHRRQQLALDEISMSVDMTALGYQQLRVALW